MAEPKKRIYNPVTKTYYQVRVKTTSAGQKGSILKKWSPPSPASRKNK